MSPVAIGSEWLGSNTKHGFDACIIYDTAPIHRTPSHIGLSKLYQRLNRHCPATPAINLYSASIRISLGLLGTCTWH